MSSISEINLDIATRLLQMFGGDDADITIGYLTDAHSGPGLYAWYTEYQEEGCEFLGEGRRGSATSSPRRTRRSSGCEKP